MPNTTNNNKTDVDNRFSSDIMKIYNNLASCGTVAVARPIKKQNGVGNYYITFKLPNKDQLKAYLLSRNTDEKEAEDIVKHYCRRLLSYEDNKEVFKYFQIMYIGPSNKWFEKDFLFVSHNLQTTMPDSPLSERLKVVEEYLLQRGPFGEDGKNAEDWLKEKKLFYSNNPTNYIPRRRANRANEEYIVQYMFKNHFDDIRDMIDKYREDSDGFTINYGFEQWKRDNGFRDPSKCNCTCVSSRKDIERETNKRRKRDLDIKLRNLTITNPTNETNTTSTAGERLVAATLGVTAATGTVAAVVGTGGGVASTGAIGAAATTAGTLAAANATTTLATATTAAATTAAGLSSWQIVGVLAGGWLGGLATAATAATVYRRWFGGSTEEGRPGNNEDIVDSRQNQEDITRRSTRQSLRNARVGNDVEPQCEEMIEMPDRNDGGRRSPSNEGRHHASLSRGGSGAGDSNRAPSGKCKAKTKHCTQHRTR